MLIIVFGPLETWEYLHISSKLQDKLTEIPGHAAVKI